MGGQYSFQLFLAWDRSISTEAVLPDLQCTSDLGSELEYATELLAAGNGCPVHGMWALPEEAASTG